jgi:hypothetical protein
VVVRGFSRQEWAADEVSEPHAVQRRLVPATIRVSATILRGTTRCRGRPRGLRVYDRAQTALARVRASGIFEAKEPSWRTSVESILYAPLQVAGPPSRHPRKMPKP